MIRRAILKAVAIPGYQVPFGSREMPLPYGWGTGGMQVTAACLGPTDVLKVIDQGADDTTNAVSIRGFFARTAGVRTTTRTAEATIIQTRHRIPETPLRDGQILVYQVPMPEPLRMLEPRERETRRLHALADYGLMHVRLYEDIARMGRVTTSYDYPVLVNGRYVMAPSPIPKFDNPKLHRIAGAAAVRRRPREAHLRRAALDHGREPGLRRTTRSRSSAGTAPAPVRRHRQLPRRGGDRRSRRADVRLLRHRPLCAGRRRVTRSDPCCEAPDLAQVVRRGLRAASTGSASISGPARCWRWSASPARARARCCAASPAGSRRTPAAVHYATRHDGRGRRDRPARAAAALAGAHRVGLRPPEPARRPAAGRHRRRQHRRAADGGGRAPLRRHPRARPRDWLRPGRDRPGAHRRRPAHLLGRHAAAAADRPQPGHAARGWCSWTSRPAASTSRCRRACST